MIDVTFRVITELTVAGKNGEPMGKPISAVFDLQPLRPLNAEMYFGPEGLPNLAGHQAVTAVLVAGLVANIHSAHQHGHIVDFEHMESIISELQRGFVQDVEVTTFVKPAR